MARKLQLQIPTPCHENWENMTQTERGRFCASCQKQVIDFSNKSDREIAVFFKKTSTGSVCGRFMDDQLNRDIEIPKKRIPWIKYFFQFLIPAFFISYKATAQGKVKVVSNITARPSKKITKEVCSRTVGDTVIKFVQQNEIDTGLKAYQVLNTSPDVIVGVLVSEIENPINGIVVDHSGSPIAFATVAIKGTKIAVAADSAGRFTIIPKPYGKNLTLSVSCVGFASVEKVIDGSDDENNVQIELQQTGTLGEVVIVDVHTHRMGLVGSVKCYRAYPFNITDTSKLKSNFIIYPNPVRSNSTLNIEWKQKDYGEHLLQLFNQSGQLLLSREINVGEGSKLFMMTMHAIISGNYFLKLTAKATGKSYTEKLIVE